MEKNFENTLKLIFDLMQSSGKIPSNKKGLIFGTIKGINRSPMKLSQNIEKFMISVVNSVAEDSLKKPKNKVAFIFGAVTYLIGIRNDEGQYALEECRVSKYKKLAKAHIDHQLSSFKYPSMLFTCFSLLCTDFLNRMEREKKFVMSYAKAKPEVERLAEILRAIIWKYPAIQLSHIKAVMGVYIKTLLRLYDLIPLSISRILFLLLDSLGLLNKMVKLWLKAARERPEDERFRDAARIREIFEYALAVLMRRECPPETANVENTASYTLLVEVLLALKTSPEEDSDYSAHGMQHLLSVLRKISNAKLSAKILIQFIYFSSYFNKLEDPSKVRALLGDFIDLSLGLGNSNLMQQLIIALCNIYRNKVQVLCSNPTNSPVLIYELSLILQNIGRLVDKDSIGTAFNEVAKLFIGVAIQVDPLVSRPRSSKLPLSLYFLIGPLTEISKRRSERCADLEFDLDIETTKDYFNIWLYIVLFKQFADCAHEGLPRVKAEEIAGSLEKLAFHTPPLTFHCGPSVWGYLKYEPCIYSISETASSVLNSAIKPSTEYKLPRSATNEEYIYVYTIYCMSLLQIRRVQKKLTKRLQYSAKMIPESSEVKKSMLLPTFFAYLFDSGIQYVPSLIELFNAVTLNTFYEYFNALSASQPCPLREHLLTEDAIFLLKSSCNLYSNIRKLSMTFLKEYCDRFPFILILPNVLFALLDIIGSLYNELYFPYDSFSHILRLPHSNQTLVLPVDKARKQDAFRFLIKLCEELYIKSALINEVELIAVYQEYVHQTISAKSLDSFAHFGISFFQNLYANYKNYDPSMTKDHSFDYLENLEAFNKYARQLIEKR